MREPTRTRLKTSRPRLSVPMRPVPFSRSSQAGLAKGLPRSMAMGSWGARRGPKTAMRAKRRRRKPPTMPWRWVQASPQRDRWGLRARMCRCCGSVVISVYRVGLTSFFREGARRTPFLSTKGHQEHLLSTKGHEGPRRTPFLSTKGHEEHLLSAKGREGARRTPCFVQDRPPGGAVRVGRVCEGTHEGCPYGN